MLKAAAYCRYSIQVFCFVSYGVINVDIADASMGAVSWAFFGFSSGPLLKCLNILLFGILRVHRKHHLP
jgi:hypothetical protein